MQNAEPRPGRNYPPSVFVRFISKHARFCIRSVRKCQLQSRCLYFLVGFRQIRPCQKVLRDFETILAFLTKSQPRSQSSSAISDVTSPVKLVGKVRAIAFGSKPPPVTLIARTGLGTKLTKSLTNHFNIWLGVLFFSAMTSRSFFYSLK